MTTFTDMNLPRELIIALDELGFDVPTPIQTQSIPLALEGNDILGSARTGTGKTAAFGIPLVARLLSKPNSSALVMTPTRELAAQVVEQLRLLLLKKSSIRTALLIGGQSMPKQLSQLRRDPQIIVGTPGRINDHCQRGNLDLAKVDFVVLDETDRMLDMGFLGDIDKIIGRTSRDRQTLLFSATIAGGVEKVASRFLSDPQRVATDDSIAVAANVTQQTLRVDVSDKYQALLDQLDERDGSVIVFMKTKHGTKRMAERLTKKGHKAQAIHGDLRQNRRDKVIDMFRKQNFRVLVATDVAARGLDISHISHVINYDLPQAPEDYVHRIGRTARAGAEGSALNLVTSDDEDKWQAIEYLLDPTLPKPRGKKGRRSQQGRRRSSGGRSSNADSNRRRKPSNGKRNPNRNGGASGPNRNRSRGSSKRNSNRKRVA